MRISTEEKRSLVARYRASKHIADICADSCVPKSMFYTWIKPYTVTMTDSGHTVQPADACQNEAGTSKVRAED